MNEKQIDEIKKEIQELNEIQEKTKKLTELNHKQIVTLHNSLIVLTILVFLLALAILRIVI